MQALLLLLTPGLAEDGTCNGRRLADSAKVDTVQAVWDAWGKGEFHQNPIEAVKKYFGEKFESFCEVNPDDKDWENTGPSAVVWGNCMNKQELAEWFPKVGPKELGAIAGVSDVKILLMAEVEGNVRVEWSGNAVHHRTGRSKRFHHRQTWFFEGEDLIKVEGTLDNYRTMDTLFPTPREAVALNIWTKWSMGKFMDGQPNRDDDYLDAFGDVFEGYCLTNEFTGPSGELWKDCLGKEGMYAFFDQIGPLPKMMGGKADVTMKDPALLEMKENAVGNVVCKWGGKMLSHQTWKWTSFTHTTTWIFNDKGELRSAVGTLHNVTAMDAIFEE